MPSLFDRVFAAAGRTHDQLAGELFDFLPWSAGADVNDPRAGGADADRAVVTDLRLPYGEPAARAHGGPARTPGVKAERPGHASDRPFVSLQVSLLPYDARPGDRLARRDTGQLFQVAEILPSTPGFVRLDLTHLGNA